MRRDANDGDTDLKVGEAKKPLFLWGEGPPADAASFPSADTLSAADKVDGPSDDALLAYAQPAATLRQAKRSACCLLGPQPRPTTNVS